MSPLKARRRRAATAVALGAVAALSLAGGAHAAPIGLPPGAQVNDDPANSIFKDQAAGVSDVVGGSLAAGGVNVPWATFEQQTPAGQQIFVRAFKGGQWSTQGFPASLNIDSGQEAEAPSIDFAGPGRTVPWVSWYEPNTDLGGAKNIFASRFDNVGKTWVADGQARNGKNVPSLNIHTDRDAENPALAGGATVAGNDPVPWVAWQEKDGAGAGTDQIFVSRGFKDAGCVSLHVFCWQPTGIQRLNNTDPTLNIDPAREGIEPDIAFTGRNDTTPWVVWYETGGAKKDQVFAARAAAPAAGDDPSVGGFKWVAVGNRKAADLNRANDCLASEDDCSLNAVPGHDAEDPRIAAGSLTPGGTAAPWVVWSEDTGSGKHAIFVSRLVNGLFQVFNNGQPVSNTVNDSTRPDITFSGNEPYITWQEKLPGGETRTFSGHFEGGAAAPVFKLDTPLGLPTNVKVDVRAPVSSGCTANPFTADGVNCPGNAAGTPFLLQTADDGRLLATGYDAGPVVTGAASAITQSSAHVDATADPAGATVKAHIEFGTTTAYGSRTGDQRLGPKIGAQAFAADLAGLPAGTTVHYRAVAETDFGTVAGADRTLVTAQAPQPQPQPGGTGGSVTGVARFTISGATLKLSRKNVVRVKLSCPSGKRCAGTVKLLAGKKVLGQARYSIKSTKQISVHLNRKGAKRVRKAHRLLIKVTAGGKSRRVLVKA